MVDMPAVTRMVHKDWLGNRTVILASLAVLLLGVFRVLPVDGTTLYGVALAIMFVFATSTQDERTNAHVFVNSLPVSRPDIVTGKYVFNIGMGIIFTGIAILVPGLMDQLPLKAMLTQLLICAGVISGFVSVFMPMYYWLGPRFVQLGLFVTFFLLVAVVPPVHNLAVRNNFWGLLDVLGSLPALPWQVLTAAGVIGLLLASWRLSIFLYGRKEF